MSDLSGYLWRLIVRTCSAYEPSKTLPFVWGKATGNSKCHLIIWDSRTQQEPTRLHAPLATQKGDPVLVLCAWLSKAQADLAAASTSVAGASPPWQRLKRDTPLMIQPCLEARVFRRSGANGWEVQVSGNHGQHLDDELLLRVKG